MRCSPALLTKRFLPTILIASLLLVASNPRNASAQSITETFELYDVMLSPDISSPGTTASLPMRGTFTWTYSEGDFENGTGEFLDLSIPWYNPTIGGLNITFDLKSIEFSLVGNFHDLGVDLTLHLLTPFDPSQSALVDTARSQFDIQQGISRIGHVISGRIGRHCPAEITDDAVVDIQDLLALLAAWGPCADCAEDIVVDDVVNVDDLLMLLGDWGICG